MKLLNSICWAFGFLLGTILLIYSLAFAGCGEDKPWILQQYQKACKAIEADECCPVCQCSADNKYVYWGPANEQGLPDLSRGGCVGLKEYRVSGGSVDDDIAACEERIENGAPCRPDEYMGIVFCGADSPITGPDKCLFASIFGRCECD